MTTETHTMPANRRSHLVRLLALALALPVAAGAAPSTAPSYPDRPIKLVVGYPAGGTGDTVARLIADNWSEAFGQPVVVENRPGAGSTIAAAAVAHAAPDGYTILLSTSSDATISPLRLGDKAQYKPRDLAPVSLLVLVPSVLTVPANSKFKTPAELVRYAKANPGKLSYASFGNGSSAHVAAEMFKSMTGIEAVHVPYKGSPDAVMALVSGDIDFFFDTLTSAMPQNKAGKNRILGVTTAARVPQAPDIPTMQEQGIKDMLSGSFIGVSAPAGTPASVIEKLQNQTMKLARVPAVREKLANMGMVVQGSTAAEYRTFIAGETARIERLVKDGKLSLQ
jgi:tripartite-type tricarboxylate transporter receptor subunit TctC